MGTGWMGMLIAAYTVGSQSRGQVPCGGSAGVSTALVLGFVSLGVERDDVDWQAIVSTTVLFAASIVLGDNMRRRRERAAELVERAERAERERELLAHAARAAGAHTHRPRTARRGGAQRQRDDHPGRCRSTAAGRPTRSRRSACSRRSRRPVARRCSEMRRVLGVLRGDDLTETARRTRAAALADIAGRPGDCHDRPAGLAAHRGRPRRPAAGCRAQRVSRRAGGAHQRAPPCRPGRPRRRVDGAPRRRHARRGGDRRRSRRRRDRTRGRRAQASTQGATGSASPACANGSACSAASLNAGPAPGRRLACASHVPAASRAADDPRRCSSTTRRWCASASA